MLKHCECLGGMILILEGGGMQVMYRPPDKLLVLQRTHCCSLAHTYTNTKTHMYVTSIFMMDQNSLLTHLLQCCKFTPLFFVAILGWRRGCRLLLCHCCSCGLVFFFFTLASGLFYWYLLRGTWRLNCCVHNSCVPPYDNQIFFLQNKQYTN